MPVFGEIDIMVANQFDDRPIPATPDSATAILSVIWARLFEPVLILHLCLLLLNSNRLFSLSIFLNATGPDLQKYSTFHGFVGIILN